MASIDARRKADDKSAVDDIVGQLGVDENQARAHIIGDEIKNRIEIRGYDNKICCISIRNLKNEL